MVNSIYFDSGFRRRRKSIQSHRRLRIGLGSGAESACKGIRLADDTSHSFDLGSFDYGNGKFVVDNFGFYEKAFRGFLLHPTVFLQMWGISGD